MTILQLESITVTIGEQTVCRNLDLQVEPRQVLGVLGCNGVGKSTLLYSIMGFHKPDAGNVLLLGESVEDTARKQLAHKVGILFQENTEGMPSTVLETALLGRHPHNENLLWDAPEDVQLTRSILESLGLDGLAHRQVSTLSGGEKQRLAIALLMVQSPQLYLLDEPSNHLDIDYQIKTLKLLENKLQQDKAAMVVASHDINLVARFCNNILLILGNGEYIFGPAREVLTEETLSSAYNCKISAISSGERHYFFPA